MDTTLPSWAVRDGVDSQNVLVRVKAVPGASRSEIVGPLGEHLKVRVTAPPENGKANEELVELLAAEFQVGIDAVTLVRGGSTARKVFRVDEGLAAVRAYGERK